MLRSSSLCAEQSEIGNQKSAIPNVVFIFGDQWRAQATGYAGDPNVKTPNIDRLSEESVTFTSAISGCPVCSPYRASLISGRRPLTHGVFVNDVCLNNDAVSIADAFKAGGYDTAYIGKWHIDGHGRSNTIPPERRQGFDYWKVLECTHDYNDSSFYTDESDKKMTWEGYDAIAQTRDAQAYINNHGSDKPFFLVLSWGPPHNPYQTAPEEFQAIYDPARIKLGPNVPENLEEKARADLAGYYAHCSALDACVGDLLQTLDDNKIADDTLFVFTSDHGDMLGANEAQRKQRPWDESIRVPFLLRYPALLGSEPRVMTPLIDAPDIMPTLLGLCDLPVPETTEGLNFAEHIKGNPDPSDGAAVIACYHAFGEWRQNSDGPPGKTGREYRGIRTQRYTYVRDLKGPWLLYDNQEDPYQQKNLVNEPHTADLQSMLDAWLLKKLDERGDEFLPGDEYIKRWGYITDENGTVPFTM